MKESSRRKRMVDDLVSEVILFGGLPLRRRDVVKIMQAEGHDPRKIAYFAFHAEAVDLEPLTLAEYRRITT